MVWCQIINTCYASSHKQGFSLIPDTPLFLFLPSLYSIFLAFYSPFNHIPSGLNCWFEWACEEKGNAVSLDAFLLGWSCFFHTLSMKLSYRYSLKLGSVATSEGKRAEEMERIRALSLLHHSHSLILGLNK